MKKPAPRKIMSKKKSAVSEMPDDLSGEHVLPEDFLIVGIGASAGGIQALKEFFENVSSESGMVYVVILHLSPDHESRLAEVLQAITTIPVRNVTEKIKVEPNCVYVVSPNEHLEMFDENIVVTANVGIEDRRAPIDIFFRTLAESNQSRAVAVVLSGTGADGSMGLKRIKERGGVCFAQNPREAEFSEMPRNAIATELVDRILNVADIPAQILAYRNNLGKIKIPVEPKSRPQDQQLALREIFSQLRLRTGHDFSNYKRATILRRIERRINVRHLQDLPSYASFVRENKEETSALLKDLLISVTNFFRDKAAFDFLETDVLPKIFAGKTSENQVRIWVTGCATGEEAYSLAMLCAEQILETADAPTVQIFATDIDEQAIATAREGFYSLNDLADVSPERLARFFTKEEDGYRIKRELRELILFATHNVLKDPPFSRLDLASCRNMLIYLNQTAQERVMETFHFALTAGGYLFLGNSETVDGASDLYAPISREFHIYQCRQIANRIAYPLAETSLRSFRFDRVQPRPQLESERDNKSEEKFSTSNLHLRLLEKFTPSVVVNEEYDIIHSSEGAVRFMQFSSGEPTRNLLKLIRPEIRIEIRTALYQAVERQTNVEIKNLKINLGERDESVNIYVRPSLDGSADGTNGFILVLFEASHFETDGGQIAYSPAEPAAGQLEEELITSKSRLRSAVEQYEIQAEELKASNEELHAMNEEMRSATEELETGKEELQSVNEELITVNQELKIKIEEITSTNDDFHNLINSTDIATIFLDRALRVNSFTPAAKRIFNLISADYGRPLSDITNNLEDDNLAEIAEKVLETLQTREREIRTDDGRVYLQRVLPYRTTDDRINGVVITFTDITERANAEAALRETEEKFRLFVIASSDTLYKMSADWSEMRWLKGKNFLGDTEKPRLKWINKYIPDTDKPQVQIEIAEAIKEKKIFEMEHRVIRADGSIGWTLTRAIPLLDDGGEIIEWFGAASDITVRKQVVEAKFFLASIVESSEDSMVTVNFDGAITSWNQAAEDLYGYSANEVIGKHLTMLTLPEDLAEVLSNVLRIQHSQKVEVYDTVRVHKGGREINLEIVLSPIKDDKGKVIGASTIARDVTERRIAEAALRESEEKLRLFVTAVSDSLYKMSGDWSEMLSLEGMDFLVNTYKPTKNWIKDYIPDSDKSVVSEAIAEAISKKKIFEMEHRVIRADGSIGWTFSRAIPMLDEAGEIIEWFGAASDITVRKQVVEALRLSEERYGLATQAVRAVIYDWNITEDRIIRSVEIEKLVGFSPDEKETQTNAWWKSRLHPEDAKRAISLVRQKIKSNAKRFEDEYRVQHRAGHYVWVNDTGLFQHDEKGRAVRCVGSITNITKRKEAEGVLERYRLLSERARDIIWLFRPDGQIVEINQAAVDAYEYTREELLGKNIADLREISTLPMLQKQIRAANRGGIKFETVHVRKDGTAFPVEVNASGGNFGGERLILEIVRDLTERRKSEEALNESETRLRLALEASQLATWEWHLDTDQIFWNDRHFLLFGMKPHSNPVQPEEFFRHVHPDDRQFINELLQKAITERSVFDADFRAVLESGEIHWMSGFGRVVEESVDGKPLQMSGVMFDITDRKKIEEYLRESEERLRLLIESAEDYAIFTMRQDGTIDSWNAGAEKIFGWTETEAIGKSCAIIFTPEDRQKGAPINEIKTALRRGRAPDERFHIRKDGSRFYVSGVMTLLKDASGKAQGFVKIARDMTEQIKAEKAIREKEILQKLISAQEDERRRIARDLHDELGQQLTALRMKLEKARGMCEDLPVCDEIDGIELLAKNIDEGVDFLAWELRPAALDQLGLIPAIDNFVQQWSQHSGVTAEVLPSSLKKRRFKREVETNLYRIVQEALNNIHKHALAKNVEIALEKRGNLIVLIIQDNGKGFDLNDKRTRTKGIGLIGMEERAVIIKGTLEIESAPHTGTIIFVRVPIKFTKNGDPHEK